MIQKIHEVQTTFKNEKEEKILNRKAAQKRVFEKHFKYPTHKDKSIENSNKLELPVSILNSKEIKTEPGEDMENVPNSNPNEIGHAPDQNTPLDILATEQKQIELNKMSKGSYTNHVDHFLAFFDPPSPHVDLAWTFS